MSDFERLYIDGLPFESKFEIENMSHKYSQKMQCSPILCEDKIIFPTEEAMIESIPNSSKRTIKKSVRR